MNSREAVCATLKALAEARVSHMLTGGLAVNLYTLPRFTKDADIVIQMESAAFDEFVRRLPAEIHLDPQITFEMITGSRRHIFSRSKGANFALSSSCSATIHTTGSVSPDGGSGNCPTSASRPGWPHPKT